MMACVSVVVPTCKRPALLSRCLEALLAQDFVPADYEVIVVDDAACAETRHLVDHRAKRAERCGHTVRYIPVMCSHGPAAARNIGWQAARGEVIAFTDDDCIPTSQWLKAGLAALADGVVGVAGRIIVPLTGIPTDYEYNASYLAQCEFATANCFYRRSALMVVGATTGSGLVALVGLVLWVYLTGRFCAQRLLHTSRAPRHVVEMIVTSVIIPPLAIFWRLRGAIKFRIFFL